MSGKSPVSMNKKVPTTRTDFGPIARSNVCELCTIYNLQQMACAMKKDVIGSISCTTSDCDLDFVIWACHHAC